MNALIIIMTVIQESSNSITVHGNVGESVSAVLNISGLSLITCIISSDNSLTGNSYDVHVSNDGHTFHYFRSVQMQGTLITNSFNPTNAGVFGSILSFNHVKIEVPAVPNVTSQLIISAR
ncbi:MAG: hypothetical protein ACHQ1D_03250 [Nitrososphaerales archaeon]